MVCLIYSSLSCPDYLSHPCLVIMPYVVPNPAPFSRTCNGHVCYFTRNRDFASHPMTRNIFFRGGDFSVKALPLPRHRRHHWSLYNDQEPSANFLLSHPEILQLFNHTATFSSFSGS